jgi:hypothetical protein
MPLVINCLFDIIMMTVILRKQELKPCKCVFKKRVKNSIIVMIIIFKAVLPNVATQFVFEFINSVKVNFSYSYSFIIISITIYTYNT